MATEERVAGLVLHSCFTTAYRVVTRWPLLPFDQYRNLPKLRAVSSPVLVVHGGVDPVIADWHGRRLLAAAKEPKRHLWVPHAGHSDLISVAGETYWNRLREFSELCASVAAPPP